MPDDAPRVFLSYSHDSDEHRDRVLALADRLRADGIDAHLDQYETSPAEGWPRWMRRQIRDADSPEEYRAMIAAMLLEIEEEAAAEREGRPVLGVEKILAQDPCQRIGRSKKSPAPMLIFADRPEVSPALAICRRPVGSSPTGSAKSPVRHRLDRDHPGGAPASSRLVAEA